MPLFFLTNRFFSIHLGSITDTSLYISVNIWQVLLLFCKTLVRQVSNISFPSQQQVNTSLVINNPITLICLCEHAEVKGADQLTHFLLPERVQLPEHWSAANLLTPASSCHIQREVGSVWKCPSLWGQEESAPDVDLIFRNTVQTREPEGKQQVPRDFRF